MVPEGIEPTVRTRRVLFAVYDLHHSEWDIQDRDCSPIYNSMCHDRTDVTRRTLGINFSMTSWRVNDSKESESGLNAYSSHNLLGIEVS